MYKEKIIFDDQQPVKTARELLDSYCELLAYTNYLTRQTTGDSDINGITKTFDLLMDRSQRHASDAGFSREDWNEGLFPVCAYIDETLICSKPQQFQPWERHQLQRKYFNTTNAGTEFYSRLEQIYPANRELIRVYSFCLALGFKGNYYHTSDKGKLEDIRYTCLQEITDNADLQYPGSFFPEAYEKGTGRLLKRKKWRRISFFSVTAFLLPVMLFAALYFFFDVYLDTMVGSYFNNGF